MEGGREREREREREGERDFSHAQSFSLEEAIELDVSPGRS